jgi:topoisomerase-4 subunit A
VIGTGQRSGKAQESNLSGADLAHHIGKRARKGKLLASRMKASQLESLG